MWKTEMEKSGRYFLFLGLVGIISGEVATVAHQSYSFHYPVLNDLVARATSQVSPVSYVSKNGLVHLRMRPVLSFLPTVKNAGYSVWGHMQRVGHNFHKAMISGFPLATNYNQYNTGGVSGGAYDNSVGSSNNNISPIRSAWTRIKCFPFGSKCHQQGSKSNNDYNNNYNNNYKNNYNNNNNDNNYKNNYKNNYNNNDNYNSNYDNFNNYNNNYQYN